MKGRFVCINNDGPIILSRSVLGVNLQYVDQGKIDLRTQASIELKDQQTGLILK